MTELIDQIIEIAELDRYAGVREEMIRDLLRERIEALPVLIVDVRRCPDDPEQTEHAVLLDAVLELISGKKTEICGSFGCTLPKGHNMGRADVPANHRPEAEHG